MIDVLPCGPCSSLAASLSGSAAKVLIALGTAQGPDGLIALCLRSIATQSGVSRSAASAALAELIRHESLQKRKPPCCRMRTNTGHRSRCWRTGKTGSPKGRCLRGLCDDSYRVNNRPTALVPPGSVGGQQLARPGKRTVAYA